ncbi:Platelet glycoprotein Ib beta chain, partial [Pleodorina starrii]
GAGGSSVRRRGASWQDLGSQRAAEQYAANLPLGLMSVSFSTAGLSRVPPLQRLLYLESLALSYNHLVGLASEQITGLSQNLKVLTLVSADLDELPPELGSLLPGLVELNLCSNRLVSLPPTLGSMTRLRSLSVAHNQLASLPPSLFKIATLEHLMLQYNRLTVIDEALGKLRSLQALDLGFNRIAQLPSETTALGGCLTRLSMPYNQLTALPPGFLSSMTHLAVLVLDFNPHLAADPQLGGGRAFSKANSLVAERSQTPTRLSMSSIDQGTRAASRSAAAAAAAEPSLGAELSFAQTPDPRVASGGGGAAAAGTSGYSSHSPGASAGSGGSGGGVMSPAPTSALSQLLAASASSAAAAVALPPTPPTPNSPGPGAGPSPAATAPQMLPALRTLSLSAVQLVQVPSWLPAGLQVLDLSRNNLRRLPSWLCRRLAPSLAVLRLHTNRIESLPGELRQMSALQLLSLEENPVASPERIATPQGAGWAAEWLYRKKYRSRPEIASLGNEHTGLTAGAPSNLNGGASAVTLGAATAAGPASAESSSGLTATTTGGGGGAAGKAAGSAAAAAASAGRGMGNSRSLRKGPTNGSREGAAA